MTAGTLPLGTMSESQPPRAGSAEPTEPSRPAEPAGAVEPATTGDSRVDEALTRLTELADKPVHEHAVIVEDIHRSLQDALAEDED